MIKEEIEKILLQAAKSAGYKELKPVISFSSIADCDFQCNSIYALAKSRGENPFEIAQKIAEKAHSEDYQFLAAKPGFLNVILKDSAIEKAGNFYLLDSRCGVKKLETSQKVILDYGGANVAKALHIGHLRPAIIGESLKRLYRFLGDEVISDVHLGDFGLQMGLTELELYEEGKLEKYFSGKGKDKITVEMLDYAYPKASERKKRDEEFKIKAEEITLKLQNKVQPYYDIYQQIREVSVKQIKERYRELGAEFDLWYGESNAAEYIDEAVSIIIDKGLARESEGALVVDVAKDDENIPMQKKSPEDVQRYKNPMPPAVIKKHNGAALYITTEIATLLMRNRLFPNVNRIEYITDIRQALHFTQAFRVCKMAGISPPNQELIHIGHGTMNGSDGKPFKTRSGDTIKLEDIINLLIEKASIKLEKNGVNYDKELALSIGVAAMKFGDLSNTVAKDYIFDIDKFLSFEGKTGPYIQYTAVRINSILKKIDIEGGRFKVYSAEEREIIKAITKLNSSYETSYNEKSLNSLCLALYDVAARFSTFYNNHRILDEKDLEKKKSYISLLKIVKKAIEQALNILAINVPEKM